jgi:hypothetical protein
MGGRKKRIYTTNRERERMKRTYTREWKSVVIRTATGALESGPPVEDT